jgi:hypothetical protein
MEEGESELGGGDGKRLRWEWRFGSEAVECAGRSRESTSGVNSEGRRRHGSCCADGVGGHGGQ